MRHHTLGQYLDQLAARQPAPGGGAAGALHAAQAAALLAMVARYSDGPRYESHADVIAAVLTETRSLSERALELAAADSAAFGRVSEAYALPKATDDEQAARSAAIAAALVEAAQPPADTVAVAARLVELAELLLPVGNRNVATDIAAAADAARAAATTARVNVEVNLRGVRDDGVRARLTTAISGVDQLAARADAVSAAVRARLA